MAERSWFRMLEQSNCFSLFRWAHICHQELGQHQQPANVSYRNRGIYSHVGQKNIYTLNCTDLDLCYKSINFEVISCS